MRQGAAWLAAAACVAGAAGAAADPQIYVVRPGETLWQIAERLAGDPDRWLELYRANRDQIKDPSRLYPGQRLAIPDPIAAASLTAREHDVSSSPDP